MHEVTFSLSFMGYSPFSSSYNHVPWVRDSDSERKFCFFPTYFCIYDFTYKSSRTFRIIYMSFEETDTDESASSLSELSFLNDDLDRMHVESGSSLRRRNFLRRNEFERLKRNRVGIGWRISERSWIGRRSNFCSGGSYCQSYRLLSTFHHRRNYWSYGSWN